MADELHDVVKLLLARMETHPEEFGSDLVSNGSIEERWWAVLREVRDHGNKTEREAIDAALRKIRLQRAHEMMMDELCNGEERRRKHREEEEYYERTMMAQQQSNMGARLRNTLAPAIQEISDQLTKGIKI